MAKKKGIKKKGILDKACAYLSGPMEFAADHGIEWRRKFIKLSKEAGLKLDIIDPTDKPGGQEVKIDEDKKYQLKLKKEGKWKDLKKYVKKYRRYDLRYVDYSDFLVVVVDPRIPQWGTANEVYVAESLHRPIFFICDGGMENMPNWLFAVIDIKPRCNVFSSVEEVIKELCGIDDGSIPVSDEWVLIRKHIEDSRN